MKLKIDTTEKQITVEETVNLNELITVLDRLLPYGEWKEYKLVPHKIIRYNCPTTTQLHQDWDTWPVTYYTTMNGPYNRATTTNVD